jgi:hypothetical protein
MCLRPQRVICNWIIHFKGWVFLLTSPKICRKFGTFKTVLSKKPFLLCCPTTCQNQQKYLKILQKYPCLHYHTFYKIHTSLSLYFIKILSVPLGHLWFDSLHILEGTKFNPLLCLKYPWAYESVIFFIGKKKIQTRSGFAYLITKGCITLWNWTCDNFQTGDITPCSAILIHTLQWNHPSSLSKCHPISVFFFPQRSCAISVQLCVSQDHNSVFS